MKRILYILAGASALVGAAAYAANGSDMIGASPVSGAMGGTGVGLYMNETDAAFKNPALVGAGATKYNLEVSLDFYKNGPSANLTPAAGAVVSSKSGIQPLPSVIGSAKITDDLSLRAGLLTYGGSVVDYTGASNNLEISSYFSLMRFLVSGSYRLPELGAGDIAVGLTPFYTASGFRLGGAFAGDPQTIRDPDHAGGFGGQVGVSWKPVWVKGLQVGTTYVSKASLNFQNILNLRPFGPAGLSQGGPNSNLQGIRVQQPAEVAAGLSYAFTENLTGAFDYRRKSWSNADGYHDLGWQDQDVFAVGFQYQMEKLALRAGFNYAKSPIQNVSGEQGNSIVNFQGTQVFQYSISALNIAAFPGAAQSHITVGAGYQWSDALGFDLALMYAPKVTITRSGTSTNAVAAGLANADGTYQYVLQAVQWSANVGASYKF